jgi:hypothetical protein
MVIMISQTKLQKYIEDKIEKCAQERIEKDLKGSDSFNDGWFCGYTWALNELKQMLDAIPKDPNKKRS